MNNENTLLWALKNYLKAILQGKENLAEIKINAMNEIVNKCNEKYKNLCRNNSKNSCTNTAIDSFINDIRDGLKDKCYIELQFITLRKLISGWSPIYFINEFPLAWDTILDTPYIPGSIIKGIVSYYYKNYIGQDLYEKLFGNKDNIGIVNFLDAYPIGLKWSKDDEPKNILTFDIITPHYTNSTRDEYHVTPNPIKYIVINKNVIFDEIIIFNDYFDDRDKIKDYMQDLMKSIIISTKMGWGRRVTRGLGELSLTDLYGNTNINNIKLICGD